MGYCTECGKTIKDGAKFCTSCGTPIKVLNSNSQRREVKYEGDIHKCPNCGAVVGAFALVCSECGFEFRNTESSNAVKEFSRKLELLESRRQPKETNSFKIAFGFTKTDPVDDQITNLIRGFGIPNNKEDIFEFMILAASSINMALFSSNNWTEIGVTTAAELTVLTAKNDAWISKFEQAYEKAKFSFGSDPDFSKINDLYTRTKSSIEKAKKQKKKKNIKTMLPLVIILGLCIMYFPIKGVRHIMREKKLEGIVQEIQTDISNGNYDMALIKVQTLHMDDGWSSESKLHWDEQRESLIKIIEEKTGKITSSEDISDTEKSEVEDNKNYTTTIDLNSLEVEAVYPQSDIGTKLYANIQLAPEIIYHTLASENKLHKTPYIITGKVIKVFKTFEECANYFGSDLKEDEEDYIINGFLLENEYGNILIQDVATREVKRYKNLIDSGNLKMSNWYNKYINEFGGYSKYEYPEEGENVAVLCIYSGYSTRFNVPISYFGLNKQFYDTLNDDI